MFFNFTIVLTHQLQIAVQPNRIEAVQECDATGVQSGNYCWLQNIKSIYKNLPQLPLQGVGGLKMPTQYRHRRYQQNIEHTDR